MPRLRTIKPGFFTNDLLAEVCPLGRLLFAGLWIVADRAGRLEDRPKRIKAEVLPYDDCDIDALLNDLAVRGFIIRYVAAGQRYIALPTWDRHQNPHMRERESTIPAPLSIETSTVLAPDEHSAKHQPSPAVLGSSTWLSPTPHGVGAARDAEPPVSVPIKAAPKPTKSGDLLDLIRAEGVPVELTQRDHGAVKRTQLSAAQVGEAYCAAFRGEWGDDWLRDNLAVHLVIDRWAGYQASKRGPPNRAVQRARSNGRVTVADIAAERIRAIDAQAAQAQQQEQEQEQRPHERHQQVGRLGLPDFPGGHGAVDQ